MTTKAVLTLKKTSVKPKEEKNHKPGYYTNLGNRVNNLEDRIVGQIEHISTLEAAVTKRKKESGLYRAKLLEFGMDGKEINIMLGRKSSGD